MKNLIFFATWILILGMTSCSKDNQIFNPIQAGEYPGVRYALERSPKINRQGAGMDFIHGDASPDTSYFGSFVSPDFRADAVFFNLMVYFEDENGDIQSEGSPAILLDENASAVEVGTGVDFFESFQEITEDMIDGLTADAEVHFDSCRTDGKFDRELIMAAYDECVIGNKFRGRILDAPADADEEDLQPVFLIETTEGGYVKFMVLRFKGSGADKQKTIVQWQVMAE